MFFFETIRSWSCTFASYNHMKCFEKIFLYV